MSDLHYLAWFYWNPERVVFTIPLIDRPVVWYGLWFVFGFIIGYFLLIPMFASKLQQTKNFLPRDIKNWPVLINELLAPDCPIKLDASTRHQLTRKKSYELLQPSMQMAILNSINDSIGNLKMDRRVIYNLFPNVFYKPRELALFLVDRLTWFVIAGTIIGARLGHVLFYEWPHYSRHPEEIYQVWKGGLASHGGAIGVIIALLFYQRYERKKFPELNFIAILDMIVVPTAFVAFCIRIGNFFNQEILGKATTLPWGVIFGDPADGSMLEPRHPVQLYEALCYLVSFFALYWLWKKRGEALRPGIISGWFFILIFGTRFLLEFLKLPQSIMIDESFLQTGQYLSIPFILLGIFLLGYDHWQKATAYDS